MRLTKKIIIIATIIIMVLLTLTHLIPVNQTTLLNILLLKLNTYANLMLCFITLFYAILVFFTLTQSENDSALKEDE